MLSDRLSLLHVASLMDLGTVEGRRYSNQALTDLFVDLQSFIRPKTFLEFGAFDGHFARTIKGRHPNARVIAFEASPRNYEFFTKEHDWKALGIEYHHLAISDQDHGTLNFHVQKTRHGQPVDPIRGDDSILKRHVSDPHEIYSDLAYETVAVDTIRLDSFLSEAQFGLDDFSAWIDVEGALKQALGGATKTLMRTRSLMIEVEEKPMWSGQWTAGDVEQHLARLGFRPVARDFEFEHQYNMILVKPEVLAHHGFQAAMVRYFDRIGNCR